MTGLRSASATDIGMVRATNQDQFLVASPLFAVADGMGGHAAGEVASKVAVDALESVFHSGPTTPQGLADAAHAANSQVWEHALTDPELRGMGTTLVAIALVKSNDGEERLAIANVGDSRAYRLRADTLEQVTIDHSLVQELIDEGQITDEEAAVHPQRHVLTRALGVDPEVAVDLFLLPPQVGDRFLLCSDGLIREVGDDLVASVLRRLADPDDAASELVKLAKEHGGNDNITVVVVDITDGTEPPPDDTPESSEESSLVAAASDAADYDASHPAWRSTPTAAVVARPKMLTARVVGFVMALVVLLAVAALGVGWYARDSYFVGLQGNQLVIFKGRPGGVLWFNPTVAQSTGIHTTQVLPYHLGQLQAGKQEGSLNAARTFATSLKTEALSATTTTTTTTTTITTTTTTTTTSTIAPTTTVARPTTTHPATATTAHPATPAGTVAG